MLDVLRQVVGRHLATFDRERERLESDGFEPTRVSALELSERGSLALAARGRMGRRCGEVKGELEGQNGTTSAVSAGRLVSIGAPASTRRSSRAPA